MSHAALVHPPDTAPVSVAGLESGGTAVWDTFVESRPDGTFFHLSGWRSVIENSLGHRCHYLVAVAGGQIKGVLPLVHVRSRLFANALISTGFTVYGGPLTEDDVARVALEEAAISLADNLGADYLEFRLRRPANPDWPRNDSLYATFRKPIAADPEKNLSAIPRKQRAMVRKGIKAGLVGRVDHGIEPFYAVYSESQRNLGTPVMSKRYFKAIAEQFEDQCQVLTVGQAGKTVAGVMSFLFRDEVLPYYGGSTSQARGVAANDFMYWDVMRRACLDGYRIFDFGRSKLGTGSFAFKRHWGFEPEPLHHEFKLFRTDRIPAFNPTNPKYDRLIRMWKRLPLPVANAIGPIISRGLG